MHIFKQFLSRVVKKVEIIDNANVLTIMNRLTHQVKDVKVDYSKLVELESPGWFWSDELSGYLIFENKGYYPPSCGSIDEKVWIVLDKEKEGV